MSDILTLRGESLDAVLRKVEALCAGPGSDLGLLSNIASLLYWSLSDVNWVGFYFRQGGDLLLGPFHGQPACVCIPIGRGVCGAAAAEKRTVVVDDVDTFPGHIACDAASRSEIVVPLIAHGEVLGVLDVDSPVVKRFGKEEQVFFEEVVRTLAAARADSVPMIRWHSA